MVSGHRTLMSEPERNHADVDACLQQMHGRCVANGMWRDFPLCQRRLSFSCVPNRQCQPQGEHRPKMMSIGMHCRIVGKPGRLRGLQRFLDHVQSHDKVWVCRRIDIAEQWRNTFPAPAARVIGWRAALGAALQPVAPWIRCRVPRTRRTVE